MAPLVPERDQAQLHPACSEMLRELTRCENQVTAILSSRRLEDLASRVQVPGIFLGGGSGLEWRSPEGRHYLPPALVQERLRSERARLWPLINEAARLPGILLEDKHWSVSLHFRGASRGARQGLEAWMSARVLDHGMRIFRGPEVFEIPFLQEADKATGLQTLCRILEADPDRVGLVYAGDDGNDLLAMRWVLDRGGTAFYVGGACPIEGPHVVDDPSSLAESIRALLEGLRRA
ncbi:MAG: hypothetical protein KGI56_00185 [Acidobacteriota bacterium]|nr:hypothetical protein [Acidobacteriota bacterium]